MAAIESMSAYPALLPFARADAEKNPIRRLDRYIECHESSFERMQKVRDSIRANQAGVNRVDQILACPEHIQSKFLKSLIYVSKYLEELGEAACDLSGWIERVSRNLISGGNKNDIAQVIGSGLGRVLSGFASAPGFSVHKMIGTCLYGLSVLTGGLAVLGIKAMGGKSYFAPPAAAVVLQSRFDKSISQEISGFAANIKEKMLSGAIRALERKGGSADHAVHKWCRHLSSEHSLHPETDRWARRTHCNYIWKNLHQYGTVTKAFMYCAYGTFQGVNKILGSYDKYLGAELGRRVLAPKLGSILGLKLGLCLAAGLATGLSFPMAPLVVSVSTICAGVCGFAMLALIAAKLNVRYGYDWNGNLAKR